MKGIAFLDGRLYTKAQAHEYWGTKFQDFRKFINDIHDVFTVFHPDYTFVTPLISFEGKDAVFLINSHSIFMMRFIDELEFDLYQFGPTSGRIKLPGIHQHAYFFYYDNGIMYLASKSESSSYLLILDPKSGARIYHDYPERNTITAFIPTVIEGEVQGFFLFDLCVSYSNPPRIHISKFVKHYKTFAYESSFIATYTDIKDFSRRYGSYTYFMTDHPTVLLLNKNLTLFRLSQASGYSYVDTWHFPRRWFNSRLDDYVSFNDHIKGAFDLMVYGDMIEEAWIIDPLCSIADFPILLESGRFEILQSPLHLTKGRIPLKRRILPRIKAIAEGFISLNMEKVASVKLGRALRSSPIPRVPTTDNLIPFIERNR